MDPLVFFSNYLISEIAEPIPEIEMRRTTLNISLKNVDCEVKINRKGSVSVMDWPLERSMRQFFLKKKYKRFGPQSLVVIGSKLVTTNQQFSF